MISRAIKLLFAFRKNKQKKNQIKKLTGIRHPVVKLFLTMKTILPDAHWDICDSSSLSLPLLALLALSFDCCCNVALLIKVHALNTPMNCVEVIELWSLVKPFSVSFTHLSIL
jgi:hypothetical protein